MSRFITIPAQLVPLLYSGLELEIWRLDEDLYRGFETREDNPGWFEAPMDSLDRTCELVCRPFDEHAPSCEKLLDVFADPATSAWLDARIRCRHLTVQALRDVPIPVLND